MKKFFENIFTIISALVLFGVTLFWYLDKPEEYIRIAAPIGFFTTIIISVFFKFSKKDETQVKEEKIIVGVTEAIIEQRDKIVNDDIISKIAEDVLKKFDEQKKSEQSVAQLSEEERKAYCDRIKQHEDFNQNLPELIFQVIEKSRNIDKSVVSKYYYEAQKQFFNGNIQEALKTLESDQSTSKENQLAEEWVLMADILMLLFRIEEAEVYYLKAIKIFPSYNTLYRTATFYLKINKFEDAKNYFEQSLIFTVDKANVAVVKAKVASIFGIQNKYSTAKIYYDESRLIFSDLIESDSEQYLPKLASVLINMSQIEMELSQINESKNHIIEAIKIFRELIINKPKKYLSNLAIGLNSLGRLQMNQNDYINARNSFLEALDIIENKIEKLSPDNRLTQAIIKNNFGVISLYEDDYENAKNYFGDSLRIFRELDLKNEVKGLHHLIANLKNSAVLYEQLLKFKKSKKFIKEAISLCRKLIEKDRDVNLPNLAACINSLAGLYEKKNNFSKAEETYKEALSIYCEIDEKTNSSLFKENIAGIMYNLASLYKESEEFSKSEDFFKKTIIIWDELSKQNSKSFLPKLANSLLNYGNLLKMRHRYKEAEDNYIHSLKIYQDFAVENSKKYLAKVSGTLFCIGNLYEIQQDYEKAEEFFNEGTEIDKKLANENPFPHLYSLIILFIDRSITYTHKIPNRERAQQFLEESISSLEILDDYKFIADQIVSIKEIFIFWGFDNELKSKIIRLEEKISKKGE